MSTGSWVALAAVAVLITGAYFWSQRKPALASIRIPGAPDVPAPELVPTTHEIDGPLTAEDMSAATFSLPIAAAPLFTLSV